MPSSKRRPEHCHVRSEIPAGDWGVRGDASLLHSAIENVVRNAIRYTREGTTVEIHLEKTEAPGCGEALVRVTIAGLAFRSMRWKSCFSHSTVWTMIAAGRRAELAWGWPSPNAQCGSTAAASPPRTGPAAASRSRFACL
jgi:hypothetical protein